jgi:hypothetical protein
MRNWGIFGGVWAKRQNSRWRRRLGRKGKQVPVWIWNVSIDASLDVNDEGLGRMIWGAESGATATNVSTRAVIIIRFRVLKGLNRAVDGGLGGRLGFGHFVKRSL